MSLDLPVVLLHWHVEDGSHWSVKMAIQFAWHFSAVFWRGESDAIWLEAQILQVWPSVAFRLDQMQEAAVKIQRAVWTYQLRKLNGGVGWSFKPASVVTSRPANDSTQPARFRSELRWQTMFRYYLIIWYQMQISFDSFKFVFVLFCFQITTSAERRECAPMEFASTWMAPSSVNVKKDTPFLHLDTLVLVCKTYHNFTLTLIKMCYCRWIDLDECAENPRICLNGRCENVAGSFECVCEEGFSSSAVGPFCVDMDECGQNGMCDNGKCINMDGSFKCVCDSGYKLSSDGKTCIGNPFLPYSNDSFKTLRSSSR